jgi:hypothetical protein
VFAENDYSQRLLIAEILGAKVINISDMCKYFGVLFQIFISKKQKLSPCYTTNLRDILVLKC